MLHKSRFFAKLNSQSGASLLMALLFILICIMVGAVVLAAAGISTERVDAGRDEEQTYLSLRSAAELIDHGIVDYTYTITASDHSSTHKDTVSAVNAAAGTAVGNFISAAVQALLNDVSLSLAAQTFSINMPASSNVPVDKVNVEMKITRNYDIYITLKSADNNYAPLELYYKSTADTAAIANHIFTWATNKVYKGVYQQ